LQRSECCGGSAALLRVLARVGYKRSLLIALAMVAAISAWVPFGNSFRTIELMFIGTGVSFALMKSAIFSSIGLFAHDMKHHASVMSYLEATYACGTFAGYFVFSAYGEGPHAQRGCAALTAGEH
jgi:MFS transporter, FHS family, glucose/mannose:H+ symporter